MPSTLSKTIRVVPQQERSERRVTAFLDAAAKLWSEVGYDALTMTEVAARSGSSIGALYNYFPDKQSLAFTLAVQYTQALEARWQPLMEQAAALTPREFAGLFLDHFIDFAREYPAFLSLVTAPVRFRRDPAARKASRQIIARAFLAKSPELTKESAFLCANISLQVAVGMMTLYAEADSKAKAAVVQEFKTMLAGYLETVLAGPK